MKLDPEFSDLPFPTGSVDRIYEAVDRVFTPYSNLIPAPPGWYGSDEALREDIADYEHRVQEDEKLIFRLQADMAADQRRMEQIEQDLAADLLKLTQLKDKAAKRAVRNGY